MKNEQTKNSGMPLVIIGIVLVAVIAGIYFLYNSANGSPGSNTNIANTNQNRGTQAAANAPAGAEPPNMLGSPTALVTVEEFADFQCPSCGAVHPMMKEIQQTYGSRIKFIFREFPLQMHDKAYDAAAAAEAAGMQGNDKFWAMQNLIYTNQKTWSVDPNYKHVFADYADKIGLDTAKFQMDAAGLVAKKRIDDDLKRGRAMNITSTPTVFVNGQMIPYPEMNVTSMRQFIDAAIQKAQADSQGANTNSNSNSK